MKKPVYSIIILIALAALLVPAGCARSDGMFSTADADRIPAPVSAPEPPPPPPVAPPSLDAIFGWDLPEVTAALYGGVRGTDIGWEDIAGTGQRHLIQNASVTLECGKFDPAVAELRGVAQRFDGYVQSEMLTNQGARIFSLVIRVPAAQFDEALAVVQDIATLRTMHSHSEDVTAQFYDIIGSLETRLIEEERVLALIDEAHAISEILALEARLSGVRLIIEQYLSQLTNMADQISFSTINVTLFDVFEEEEEYIAATALDNITTAFGDSIDGIVRAFQSFSVWLAGAVLPLSIFAAIGLAIWLVVRKHLRIKIR